MPELPNQETRVPVEGEYLICPKHPGVRIRLVEIEDDEGQEAECLWCGYTCRNYLRYPVVEICNVLTGEVYLQNIMTGARVPG